MTVSREPLSRSPAREKMRQVSTASWPRPALPGSLMMISRRCGKALSSARTFFHWLCFSSSRNGASDCFSMRSSSALSYVSCRVASVTLSTTTGGGVSYTYVLKLCPTQGMAPAAMAARLNMFHSGLCASDGWWNISERQSSFSHTTRT